MSLPPQSFTPQAFYGLPSKKALQDEFVGKPLSSLRTPAFIVDRAVFASNCARMHQSAKDWGAQFRAHVKTHKTTEGTRLQLVSTADKTSSIVVSTLIEAWEVVKDGLVKEGIVKDILYGLPLAPTKIADLARLADELQKHSAQLRLMIDNVDQIRALEAFNRENARRDRWSAFIKVDHGGKRAGLTIGSPGLKDLIELALASGDTISIYGFYCHAGDSYASTSLPQASSFLSTEVQAVNAAAELALSLQPNKTLAEPYVLSVGSTPTAHTASQTTRDQLKTLLKGNLEIHAGNYPICDLQQLHTSLITPDRIAQRVLASVISYYPGRGTDGTDEAMCDAGGIAMSRDTGPSGGFGDVIVWGGDGKSDIARGEGWKLGRCSQEHGILVRKTATSTPVAERDTVKGDGGQRLALGSLVTIVAQHACLTSAAYPWYYVVDSSAGSEGLEKVIDVWVPWKGW